MHFKIISIFLLVVLFTLVPSGNTGSRPPQYADTYLTWLSSEFKTVTGDFIYAGEYPGGTPPETKEYPLSMLLSESVESYLEYFTTSGRNIFKSWLSRSARFVPVMKEIFREKNLPEELVYVAMIESGFDPDAVSWADAVGPWQFMPGTAEMYGLRMDQWVDERKDPVKATYAAAEHLKDLHNLFGSWPLALASYNAGAGKVQRAILRNPSEDFQDLSDSRAIRRETKHYIPRFIAAVIISKNAEAYGFTLPNVEPFQYDEVEIRESADLHLIALSIGCTDEEVKELNPELLQPITPPNTDSYILRIPKGRKQYFLANFARLSLELKAWQQRERAKRAGISRKALKNKKVTVTYTGERGGEIISAETKRAAPPECTPVASERLLAERSASISSEEARSRLTDADPGPENFSVSCSKTASER